MNRERELLQRVAVQLLVFDLKKASNLHKEIEELLTQPEQEPVAWCQMVEGKVQDLLTSFEMKDWLYDKSWMPLYLAPPKRERLSDGATADMWHANKKATNAVCYWAGVYDAEKAHDITGVVDDE